MPGYLPDSTLIGSVWRRLARRLGSAMACAVTWFSGVPGILPDSSLDDCLWFRGDGSLDGSFGSAAADTTACLTARSAIGFGGSVRLTICFTGEIR
jgi:hypothetical protein